MKHVRSRLRCSKLTAACISVALLLGATSGITYAATDGATANPVKAFRVYINGEEYDAEMQRKDDGYVIHLNQGDTADVEIETDGEAGSVAISQESSGTESDLTISEDGSFVSAAICEDDSSSGGSDDGSAASDNSSGEDGSSDRESSSGSSAEK